MGNIAIAPAMKEEKSDQGIHQVEVSPERKAALIKMWEDKQEMWDLIRQGKMEELEQKGYKFINPLA